MSKEYPYEDLRRIKTNLEQSLQELVTAVRTASLVGPEELTRLREAFEESIDRAARWCPNSM